MNVLVVDGIKYKTGCANLGLGFLVQYIRKDHNIRVVTLAYHDLAEILSMAKKFDLVGFSCISSQYKSCLALAKELKKQQTVPIVFGGVHPTALPEEVMSNPEIDFVCVGESEISFSALLDAIELGKTDFSEVPGICFRTGGGELCHTTPTVIDDLDTIGMPAWDLLEYDKAAKERNVITSRACPYTCSYCYNSTMRERFRHKYRRRSVESVVDECLYLKSEDINYIAFSDDLFLFREDWLLEFSELYGAKVGIPFGCAARPEMVLRDTRALEALKRAGLRSIWIGIESGNDRIRQEILNRKMSNEDILAAFRRIKQLGLKSKSYNMVGIPTEGFREAVDTFLINLKARPTGTTSYYTLIPYPGTKISKLAYEMKLFGSEVDFDDTINIKAILDIRPGMLNTGKMNRYHVAGFRCLWEFVFFRFQRRRLMLRLSFLFSAIKYFIMGFLAEVALRSLHTPFRFS